MDVKVHHLKVDFSSVQSTQPTIIDNQVVVPRIGAFEVQLYIRGEKPLEQILHSKLATGVWPNVAVVLENIHYFQPRIPKLTLQIFSDDSSTKKTTYLNLSGISVALRSAYKNTGCQEKLNQTLNTMEQERL